jgi:hypothetical protein
MMTSRPAGESRHSPRSPFGARIAPPIEQFSVEDRVSHDKFGLGRVIGEEPSAVVVAFGSQHVRITSPFSRLTKL